MSFDDIVYSETYNESLSTEKEPNNELSADDLTEAIAELVKTSTLMTLAADPNMACSITIKGMTVDLCTKKGVMPVLERHRQEVGKAIRGEKNEWS